ncbi:FadR/GntR family transcriptional regulator [Fusobacterium sp. PH5-44]|uniref:FadR/GntR family transcriptional regulator n=1 Tax=unclassified Fusobacterium TaxID=2648384 RepID=UPI003D20A577
MKKKEDKNITLTEKAARDIIKLIEKNKYVVGDKIPIESELSKILNVGRNTTREALRVLASRNIVVIKQGAGTFIADNMGKVDDPFGFRFYKDRNKLTEDLMEIRWIMEPKIAALAAENAKADDIKKLEKILITMEKLIESNKDFLELDMEFHKEIANCTKNVVMTNLIPVITKGVSVFAKNVKMQERKQTIKSHRAIFSAISEKKSVEAENSMLYHLFFNRERFRNEK